MAFTRLRLVSEYSVSSSRTMRPASSMWSDPLNTTWGMPSGPTVARTLVAAGSLNALMKSGVKPMAMGFPSDARQVGVRVVPAAPVVVHVGAQVVALVETVQYPGQAHVVFQGGRALVVEGGALARPPDGLGGLDAVGGQFFGGGQGGGQAFLFRGEAVGFGQLGAGDEAGVDVAPAEDIHGADQAGLPFPVAHPLVLARADPGELLLVQDFEVRGVRGEPGLVVEPLQFVRGKGRGDELAGEAGHAEGPAEGLERFDVDVHLLVEPVLGAGDRAARQHDVGETPGLLEGFGEGLEDIVGMNPEAAARFQARLAVDRGDIAVLAALAIIPKVA